MTTKPPVAPHDSPYEVVLLVASWALLVTLSSLVVRRDERKLDEAQLERAWTPASRDNALIGLSLLGSPLLGLFAVAYHFARTRRFRPVGLLQGLGWSIGILAINVVSMTGLAWLFDLPLE
ncbi:hypothetical protein AKJ09_08468 [Labilithrix luteola]|uniref:Uncharacterized protein n=1 Tax=Labilithrix luteola TaxID=1391654 RepID=A0A0K1Q8T0_9BACT|nr:hypothetical protein [Labilithrix luteola]AKV01805.1 hypothetical protein AKJ09_08468 [Labilithrix luteola]